MIRGVRQGSNVPNPPIGRIVRHSETRMQVNLNSGFAVAGSRASFDAWLGTLLLRRCFRMRNRIRGQFRSQLE